MGTTPYDARAFTRVVDRIICPSSALLSELTRHYRDFRSPSREVFVFTANDVDALAAVHMLQDFLTAKLSLRLVVHVISSYTELERVFSMACKLGSLAQASAVCLFVNLGARYSIQKLLTHLVPADQDLRHLWFILDYQRPFSQLYVEQGMRELHEDSGSNNNNVRCMMVCTEAETKFLAQSAEEITSLENDEEMTAERRRRIMSLQEPSWKSRSQAILALLTATGGGEYFGLPTVLVVLEALKEHQAETTRSMLCAAVGFSFHLLNSSMNRIDYDAQMRKLELDLNLIQKRNQMECQTVQFTAKEIYLPLLRFCSLKDTIRTCPIFLSSRMNTAGSWRDVEIDLGGIRLELDVDQAAWNEIASADLVAQATDCKCPHQILVGAVRDFPENFSRDRDIDHVRPVERPVASRHTHGNRFVPAS